MHHTRLKNKYLDVKYLGIKCLDVKAIHITRVTLQCSITRVKGGRGLGKAVGADDRYTYPTLKKIKIRKSSHTRRVGACDWSLKRATPCSLVFATLNYNIDVKRVKD